MSQHPGQEAYPDLNQPIKGHKVNRHVTADVYGGCVSFYDEEDGETVVMTEWDFGNFVEAWLDARMEEKFPPPLKVGDRVRMNCDHAGMEEGEEAIVIEVGVNNTNLIKMEMVSYVGIYNMEPRFLDRV